MKTPNFQIVANDPYQPLVIRDVGPWDQYPSVTNGAEEVVQDLNSRGLLAPGRRLFYYDSEGALDELVFEFVDDKAAFRGFRPGPIRSNANPETRRMKTLAVLTQVPKFKRTYPAAKAISVIYGTFDDMFVLALSKAVEVLQGRCNPIEAADHIESEYRRNWSKTKKKRKPATALDDPGGGEV